ncbi:MAG TPA: hypothetical protein DCQ98_06225 [Planctomycetaceae bacterium]|nr:hypothetical protein [Planctomycetaceae bacterium]
MESDRIDWLRRALGATSEPERRQLLERAGQVDPALRRWLEERLEQIAESVALSPSSQDDDDRTERGEGTIVPGVTRVDDGSDEPVPFVVGSELRLSENAEPPQPTTRLVSEIESDPTLGRTIGPYRILERIGRGGMGSVYLAEQRHPVSRRVALKLIRSGMDSGQIVARFEAERRALAMMEHPHIAKVLDAGATDDGLPYFVMEWVRGTPIVDFCDRRRLDLTTRLELFRQTCAAVQHAHQKGIIHRDLKPSNILVTTSDDRPIVKVIDFGLAKATHQPLTDRTMFTALGQVVGTLEYMSPEQARLDESDIDTRTDVYSLGVLLYELLTGSTPLRRESLRGASIMSVLSRIRDEEPQRPSARLAETSDASSSVHSSIGGLQSKRLSVLMRGDLDWIVLRAIEKDRERRYESPGSLAADIGRFLADEPIEARPPSAAYRLRKFVRKNRSLVTLVATVVVLLALGLVSSGLLTRWALQERREASTARDVAQENFARAQAERDSARLSAQAALAARDESRRAERRAESILGLLVDSFRSVDPADGAGRPYDRPASAVLLDSSREIDERLSGDPVARGKLRSAICQALEGLGRHREAVEVGERAVADLTSSLGNSAPDTLEAERALAWARYDASESRESLATIPELAERCRRSLGPEHLTTLSVERLRGILLRMSGDRAGEVALAERGLELARSHYPADRRLIAVMTDDLASALVRAGEDDRAIELQREALALATEELGDRHPHAMVITSNLASFLTGSGGAAEALDLLETLLARRVETLGPDHPSTLGTESLLGDVLGDLGRFDQAIPHYRRAIDGYRASIGEGHPRTLAARLNLGIAHYRSTDCATAVELLESLVDDATEHLGPTNLLTLDGMQGLAAACECAGDPRRAKELNEIVLAKRIELQGEEAPYTLQAMNNLAVNLERLGEHARAAELHERTLAMRVRQLGEQHAETTDSRANLANALLFAGQVDRAIALQEQVVEERRAAVGDDDPQTLAAVANLATAHYIARHYDRTVELLEPAIERQRAALGDTHPAVLMSLNTLGATHYALGDHRRAAELFEQCLTLYRKTRGDRHPETLLAMNNAGAVAAAVGDHQRAVRLHEEALVGRTDVLGPDHPDVLQSMTNLAAAYEQVGNPERATDLRERLVDYRRRMQGASDPMTLEASAALAKLLADQGETERLIRVRREELEAIADERGALDPATGDALERLAEACEVTAASEEKSRRAAIDADDRPMPPLVLFDAVARLLDLAEAESSETTPITDRYRELLVGAGTSASAIVTDPSDAPLDSSRRSRWIAAADRLAAESDRTAEDVELRRVGLLFDAAFASLRNDAAEHGLRWIDRGLQRLDTADEGGDTDRRNDYRVIGHLNAVCCACRTDDAARVAAEFEQLPEPLPFPFIERLIEAAVERPNDETPTSEAWQLVADVIERAFDRPAESLALLPRDMALRIVAAETTWRRGLSSVKPHGDRERWVAWTERVDRLIRERLVLRGEDAELQEGSTDSIQVPRLDPDFVEALSAKERRVLGSSALSAARRAATDTGTAGAEAERAVRLAQWAIEIAGDATPEGLDALAAAQARSGEFDRAVATIDRALDRLPAASDQRQRFTDRRARYVEKKTLDEPAGD